MGEWHRIIYNTKAIGKGRPRFGKGFTYTPKKSRDYESFIALNTKQQFIKQPLSGPVHVKIEAQFVKPKTSKKTFPTVKPDCDNCAKGILDSNNGILWLDDAQIVSLEFHKRYGPKDIITLLFQEIE